MIKLFYDLETTGLNFKNHSIHRLAGMVEIDNEIVESFDLKLKPHPRAKITPEALTAGGVTEAQIMKYPDMKHAYAKFSKMLAKYVNRYNKRDRIKLVGYNNRFFDDQFLRMLFLLSDDNYFEAWFWSDSSDTLVLASEYLENRRRNMPDFKLKSVARELGLRVEEDKLHDGVYDVMLTRQIYRIVTGKDIEI